MSRLPNGCLISLSFPGSCSPPGPRVSGLLSANSVLRPEMTRVWCIWDFSPFLNELAAIPSVLTTSLFPHFLLLLSARCVMKVIWNLLKLLPLLSPSSRGKTRRRACEGGGPARPGRPPDPPRASSGPDPHSLVPFSHSAPSRRVSISWTVSLKGICSAIQKETGAREKGSYLQSGRKPDDGLLFQ